MEKKKFVERIFSCLISVTVLSVFVSLLYSIFFLETSLFVRIIMGISAALILILAIFLYIAGKISQQAVDAIENVGRSRLG